MSLRPFLAAFALACLAASVRAQSDFTSAVTPSFRGASCTEFGDWETFTIPYNGANHPDAPGSTSDAGLTQLIPGAIITSTGNIYHPSQTPAFRLEDSVGFAVQEVVLQTATFGNPRNQGSFILSFTNASQQTVVLAPTNATVLVSNPQANEELYFRWDLSSFSDTILDYRIDWVSSAPNSSLGAVLLDVRMDCPPGSAQCFGDGSGSACPCVNNGAAGNGCANSVNVAGGNLAAHGRASVALDTVILTGSGMPNSSCLYFQGTTTISTPFGDGLRCAGGQVIRLGITSNSAGSSQYPAVGQQPVSVRGAVASGDVRIYQAWYRNAAAFCTSGTFNLSNAYRITWTP
jgi:hypothetical protein